MDPTNKDRERDVDQWLDAELSRFGKAEPRSGLESRVLANLQAERSRIVSGRRWWWTMGAAAAMAAMVAAVWVWESGREVRPGNAAGIATTTHREEALRSTEPAPVPRIAHPAGSTPARQVATHRPPPSQPSREMAVAATPKLEQFPSRRPLSEQEQILMSYVAKYPETAVLVAQAQAEALQRDREEEAAAAAKGNTE